MGGAMTNSSAGVILNLPNQEYRDATGLSASFLKRCLKSVKHAMTPSHDSKSLSTGRLVHEFLLEPDIFNHHYASDLDPDQHLDALFSTDQLKAAIAELNELRKPKLKTTGSRDSLVESIRQDDPHHFDSVQDSAKLSVDDLRKRIQFINTAPNRGLLSTSGTQLQLAERLADNGYAGELWPIMQRDHREANAGLELLPPAEYNRLSDMRASLINHLEIGAQTEPLFGWLLAAFQGGVKLETEVSVFATDAAGSTVKCRLDGRFMAGDKRVGIELKTARDADAESFEKSAVRLHYDLAHEHYLSVCSGSGEPLDMMVFIAIEPDAPHGVSVLVADEEFRLTGTRKLAYAKRRYREYCSRSRNTVYSPKLKTISSPLWNTCGPWENEPVEGL